MNTVARFGLVASIALTAQAHADQPVPTEDVNLRIAAMQPGGSTRVLVDAGLLDEYAGRYELDDGRVFIVLHEGDSLTIELPAELALPPLRLTAAAPREFYSTDAAVRVVFEVDSNDRMTGAVVHVKNDAAPIVASKTAPRRGIVTIYDIVTAGTGGGDR